MSKKSSGTSSPPTDQPHSSTDHSSTDHSSTDHSSTDHLSADHSSTDHSFTKDNFTKDNPRSKPFNTSSDPISSSSPTTEKTERLSGLRGLFEAVVPESVKRAIHQGVDSLSEERLRETLAAELLRRTMEKGTEVVDQTEGSVRRILQSAPSELVDRVLVKLDDYKDEGIEILRGELRRFLDRVDLNKEIQSILSQFSVEVSTEIRFVPNDEGGLGVKPAVKTRANIKRTPKEEQNT